MKSVEEIESILSTYSGGPIVITAAKDLLKHYKNLEKELAEAVDRSNRKLGKIKQIEIDFKTNDGSPYSLGRLWAVETILASIKEK